MAIRIGVIGTGKMGSTHVSQFSKMADVEVVACCDIIRERAEKCVREHGAKSVAANLEEVLERCDAVVIATPDPCHTPMSLRVLATGKHLLCEKPLACSLEETRRVAKAAQAASRNGQIHMVHFAYRRSAAVQEAMRLARSGALGQIRQVHSAYLQSWLSCHPAWGQGEGWRAPYLLWKLSTSQGSRGVLGDLGCHLLDMTTACSEELKAVRCELRTFPKPLPDGQMVARFDDHDLDADDMALMELQLAGGGLAIAHTSRWATGYTNTIRVEVHGTEGAVRLDLDRSYEAIELCLGEARHRQTWDRKYLPPAPSVSQLFIRAIQTGEQKQPDLLRGAQVQAYLESCLRSAETRAWEIVPARFESTDTT